MTTTYTPDDPAYLDEGDLRVELGRVFDLCHGCRLCFNLCPSFPTMFDFIDARDGAVGEMTAAEQDQVVDECYQCKLCFVICPYTPERGRDEMAHRIAQPLMDALREATTDLIAGDCQLANTAIREATTKVPVHPIQVLAHAYGLEGD
jgi:Fe-S oxidoreductase